MFQRIVLEADSVDEATRKMQSEMPEGYELLLTEVLCESKSDTLRCSAPTTENAFAKAHHKIAKGGVITRERELTSPRSETLVLEAADERIARSEVENRIAEGTKIQSVTLDSPGSQGFLGFGKKPNRYRAQLFHPAVVEVSYSVKAKVSFTLMSRQAAEEARKAVEELVGICDQTAKAEDSDSAVHQIRAVGYQLESGGGFDLMLAAHALLVREKPRAKRALEKAWDGIGAWIA